MDIIEPMAMTIKEAANGLKNKLFSCEELVRASLGQINKFDKQINAFVAVCEKEAIREAKEIDIKISKREILGPLAGIPFSAKDVFCTKGIRTTACSNILNNFIPPYDATAIKRLKDAGAILIGKTNHDAFGFGSSTENSDFQVTKNPWNQNKVAGGSSGGSAAAVSAGMGLFSIAEDTGGSIRQPACFCGVSGIKVTYGRVSRYGVIAYGSSLDTIGVIAKTIDDTAAVLNIIAGKDPYDATTLNEAPADYLEHIDNGIADLVIGIPEEYFISGMDKEMETAIKEAIKEFERLGAKIKPISLPYTKYAIPAYYLSGISEVSANLARYDGIRFGFSDSEAKTIEEVYQLSRAKGFGPEVKRRIILGTYALSAGYYDAYYKKAQQIRKLIKNDFEKAFSEVNIIAAPVSPFPAFNIGEKTDDPLKMWLADIFTVTANPAGIPALAIPCGFSEDDLPLGMQLIGPLLSEQLLFRAGYSYQMATNWNKNKPKL